MLIIAYYQLSVLLFGRHGSHALWSLIAIIIFPFFLSLTANVIRQGIATAFIIFAIKFIIEQERKLTLSATLFSILFHRSSLLIIPFVLVGQSIAKVPVKFIVTVWVGVSIASWLEVFQKVFKWFFKVLSSYGFALDYGSSAIEYTIGFRYDFWIFSSLSVFFLCIHKHLEDTSKAGKIFFRIPCYFSIIHIALFSIAYNDRFGIYAWILYPIQVIYIIDLIHTVLLQKIKERAALSEVI